MANRRKAGRVAKAIARKSFRTAIKMPKRKLAKVYATKMGQTAFVSVRKTKNKRRSRRSYRKRRRY